MANATNSKSGGFGLGPVVVVGAICFVLGYLAATFVPVLTSANVRQPNPATVSHTPRTDENAGRATVDEEAEQTQPAATEEPVDEKASGATPEKAPTP